MPVDEPLLLTASQAAGVLNVSRSAFYALHASGRLGPLPIRFGRSTRWRRDEIVDWVAEGCPPRVKWIIRNKEVI